MRRGTTPTVRARVNSDLHGLNVYLTFELAKDDLMTKTGEDLNISYETEPLDPEDPESELVTVATIVETTLTQEDTLRMKAGKAVQVQIRAERMNGEIACASSIKNFVVEKILLDGRIPL